MVSQRKIEKEKIKKEEEQHWHKIWKTCRMRFSKADQRTPPIWVCSQLLITSPRARTTKVPLLPVPHPTTVTALDPGGLFDRLSLWSFFVGLSLKAKTISHIWSLAFEFRGSAGVIGPDICFAGWPESSGLPTFEISRSRLPSWPSTLPSLQNVPGLSMLRCIKIMDAGIT